MTSGKNIKNLCEIPRIGERVAGKLIEHFGTEDAALAAILKGDIAALSGISGISQHFALSLARDAKARAEEVSISDFLKTKEALELYSHLLRLIQGFAHTSHAREKLSLFYPYPAARKDLIEKRRAFLEPYLKISETLAKDQEFLALFSKLEQLKPVPGTLRVRDRVILSSDPKTADILRERFGKVLPVQGVESLSEFVDVARGYSQVLVFDDTFLGFDLPPDLEPEFFPDPEKVELWQVVPEKELIFFARNLECIKACLSVVSTLRARGFSVFEALSGEESARLEALLGQLTPNGSFVEGLDSELDRLEAALTALDSTLKTATKDANLRLSRALEESSVTLKGQDLLKLANGGLEIKDLLTKEVHSAYSGEVDVVTGELSEKLGLESNEKLLLESLFSPEISYPLAAEPRALQLFRQALTHKLEKAKLAQKRKLAKALAVYRPAVETLVREVLEFDLGFSAGCFAVHFGLSMPELISSPGIGIKAGENLFLKARHGKASPVSYSVGRTKFSPKGSDSRVVLLSGVNSGGKTSLLELLAQCVVLGNMGFPVPAAALKLGPVDELYYFGKSKGTLDAGAFETTLKQFSVLSETSCKLVLADELESITEPGASARIIAGILEFLSQNELSLGIFVSHLSELILENTETEVRVDGIEAKGLDSNLELIVDRNPVYNHVAKSTPELIVERLLRKTSGKEKEFYELLRNKF